MKGYRVSIAAVVTLLLVMTTGLTNAQRPVSESSTKAHSALGTAFTYQGRLTKDGQPVDGKCDLTFELYDEEGGGTPPSGGVLLGTVEQTNQKVSDGYFIVRLDFGSGVFNGSKRWLEISADCGGGPITLAPRQGLAPAPYALALPGLWTEQNDASANIIGGYSGNSVGADVVGATIGGGGGSDYPNRVADHYGTVSGGEGNTTSGSAATVGGGWGSTASGDYATVAGGFHITVTQDYATVAGGGNNTASGSKATVAGGRHNTASAPCSSVGGGWRNSATGWDGTVGGGAENTAAGSSSIVSGGHSNTANGPYATVSGGRQNFAASSDASVGGGASNVASGYAATVPGGDQNTAEGDHSFAAGRRAKALSQGCFVWGDSTDAEVVCDGDDRWVARASGGVYFYSDSSLSTGVYLQPGSSQWAPIPNPSSDRDLKENLASVETQEVLRRVAALPISTWNYRTDADIRHMGPMAQDFYGAFGLGEDDESIHTIDADGVALASIQALHELSEKQSAQISQLREKNVALENEVEDLAASIEVLEKLVQGGPADERLGGKLSLSLDWALGVGLVFLGTKWWAHRREGGSS